MKQRKLLPLAALVMGLACQIGRWTLYRTAVDATGLLTAGTPLEWGSYALSVLAIGLFAAAAGKLRESDAFASPSLAALGQLIGDLLERQEQANLADLLPRAREQYGKRKDTE